MLAVSRCSCGSARLGASLAARTSFLNRLERAMLLFCEAEAPETLLRNVECVAERGMLGELDNDSACPKLPRGYS